HPIDLKSALPGLRDVATGSTEVVIDVEVKEEIVVEVDVIDVDDFEVEDVEVEDVEVEDVEVEDVEVEDVEVEDVEVEDVEVEDVEVEDVEVAVREVDDCEDDVFVELCELDEEETPHGIALQSGVYFEAS
ncbi:MAG: hypothetical protein Q9167_005533, partial [Letrouitia subvulpina]